MLGRRSYIIHIHTKWNRYSYIFV